MTFVQSRIRNFAIGALGFSGPHRVDVPGWRLRDKAYSINFYPIGPTLSCSSGRFVVCHGIIPQCPMPDYVMVGTQLQVAKKAPNQSVTSEIVPITLRILAVVPKPAANRTTPWLVQTPEFRMLGC